MQKNLQGNREIDGYVSARVLARGAATRLGLGSAALRSFGVAGSAAPGYFIYDLGRAPG